MLEAFSAPGRFWRGNLHGHSNNSDGALPPDEVCRLYREAGYDFTTLTDHFLPEYNSPITDTREERGNGFTTLLGAEVHAPKTALGELWHLVAVGLPANFEATGPNETGPELARRCRKAGAFVAIAHPHWYHLTLADALTIDAAHAVEVYNHTCHIHNDRGDGLVLYDQLLHEGKKLYPVAVDDSHWNEPDGFGGWVMVKAPANEPNALLSALKAGQFYASQGPEIHDVRHEHGGLTVECSAVATIMLLGPGWKSEKKTGPALTRARFDLERFHGAWCRLVVADAMGKRAWTAALWLD